MVVILQHNGDPTQSWKRGVNQVRSFPPRSRSLPLPHPPTPLHAPLSPLRALYRSALLRLVSYFFSSFLVSPCSWSGVSRSVSLDPFLCRLIPCAWKLKFAPPLPSVSFVFSPTHPPVLSCAIPPLTIWEQFTDWSETELKQNRGLDKALLYHTVMSDSAELRPDKVTVAADLAVDAPFSLDWRADFPGTVSSVKNQGSCGSCWTFASAETLESRWFLATGDSQDLSEQVCWCVGVPVFFFLSFGSPARPVFTLSSLLARLPRGRACFP